MRQLSSLSLTQPFSTNSQLVEEAYSCSSFSKTKLVWKWSQEWNNLIFLHWKIPAAIIYPLIPNGLSLDTFKGSCMVTLVAYTMNNIRHIYTPAIPHISDFHQVNIRTYVIKDNKPGIYIFHIEAEKILPVLLAKMMSGLVYKKASMKRSCEDDLHYFTSKNNAGNFSFEASYQFDDKIKEKTELDTWLLNRYHLYQYQNKKLYRFDINREPWVLHQIHLKILTLNYKIGDLLLNSEHSPVLAHYSKGIRALVWKRKLLHLT